MAAPTQPPPPPATRGHRFNESASDFWNRITDGMELAQLWAQFRADAQSTYRLYSRDVVKKEYPRRKERYWEAFKQFFWAVMMKLTPARRLLLLVALLLIILPLQWSYGDSLVFSSGNMHQIGGLLLLIVLLLEVADRVTMKRDLEIAREIQLWLVPAAPPQIPGLDLAFINRPANTVAGDYYDVVPRAGNKVLLVVADVAGKSLPAALLAATFQASLRTLSANVITLPELVAGVNGYCCAHSRGGLRFTTAFLADYDPATGAMEYINAGHNAPVLQRCSGVVERLENGGLPLGISTDAPYLMGSTSLTPGDLLLIFTDGLVEAVNDKDEEFEEQRMLSSLQATRGAGAQQVVHAMMQNVAAFVGMTHQHDDITCLAAKRV